MELLTEPWENFIGKDLLPLPFVKKDVRVKLFAYHADIKRCLYCYQHMMTSKNQFENLIFVNKEEECDYYIILNKWPFY